MKSIEILSGALVEIARENIELERERATERESVNYWHKKYTAQNAECKELTLLCKETQLKLDAATKTVANLEEYIKLLEKGVQKK